MPPALPAQCKGATSLIWMMAARNEAIERLFGVVNTQPGSAGAGSSLEANWR